MVVTIELVGDKIEVSRRWAETETHRIKDNDRQWWNGVY